MQRSAYQQLADVLSPNITGIKGCILAVLIQEVTISIPADRCAFFVKLDSL